MYHLEDDQNIQYNRMIICEYNIYFKYNKYILKIKSKSKIKILDKQQSNE